MFSNRNKKIFTGLVIVIVALGLLGPGVLLIFSPRSPVPAVRNTQPTRPEPEIIHEANLSTSSADLPLRINELTN